MTMTKLIASLMALLALSVAGVSQGAFGIEASDVARLVDAAVINAWPSKYTGCC